MTSGVAGIAVEPLSCTSTTGITWPLGSTYGVVTGVLSLESSRLDLLESQELRNRAANAPLGADNGPGEMAIMLPVLARCIEMSVSGGKGAVCGTRDPDTSSLSPGFGHENRLFALVDEGYPTLLP